MTHIEKCLQGAVHPKILQMRPNHLLASLISVDLRSHDWTPLGGPHFQQLLKLEK